MNITSDYQLNSVHFGAKVPRTNLKQTITPVVEKADIATKAVAAAISATALGGIMAKNSLEKQVKDTDFGKVDYVPDTKLDVTRKNGMEVKLFENIPTETLKSPLRTHMHQVNAHTVNPKAIVFRLVQNASEPIKARKIVTDGTVGECMATNNFNNVPMKFDVDKDNPYILAPYTGQQLITGNAVLAQYGTTKWATDEYNREFLDPATGEAPDIAVVADQKGSVDQSIMPADIADRQYDIVEADGVRKPCSYDEMEPGVDYMFSKRPGVALGGFVTSEEVISSEGEKIPAGKFVMVDSLNHCYDSNPIDRILKNDVTWDADMNDPVQAKMKNSIDEIFRLKAEAGEASSAGNKELADTLSQQAKQLTNQIKQQAAEWTEAAQKETGVDYFVES